MKKSCRSGDRLFRRYRKTIKDWVASINNLRRPTPDPYLMRKIEECRLQALKAKTAYKEHLAEHKCGSEPQEDIHVWQVPDPAAAEAARSAAGH
jgi:hypothetical protein